MKCVRGEVSFGDKWVYERLTAKKCVWKRGWAIEGRKRGESALCAVQYNLALWFLSRGHVANFPTDGIHFLCFTFPWTPCFTPCFAPTFSGSRSPLPSSSAPAVIRGKVSHRATTTKCKDVAGGFLLQKKPTFAYHFGLVIEVILLSRTKVQALMAPLGKSVHQMVTDWHATGLFDTYFVSKMKKKLWENDTALDSQSILNSFIFC